MSTCKWKTPNGSTSGLVVWSVGTRLDHCPRCCGIVAWIGWRGMCATGHVLVLDGWEK